NRRLSARPVLAALAGPALRTGERLGASDPGPASDRRRVLGPSYGQAVAVEPAAVLAPGAGTLRPGRHAARSPGRLPGIRTGGRAGLPAWPSPDQCLRLAARRWRDGGTARRRDRRLSPDHDAGRAVYCGHGFGHERTGTGWVSRPLARGCHRRDR